MSFINDQFSPSKSRASTQRDDPVTVGGEEGEVGEEEDVSRDVVETGEVSVPDAEVEEGLSVEVEVGPPVCGTCV